MVELFWPSGLIKRRAFFAKGLRNGEDSIWSNEGILLDVGNYIDGKPIGKQQKFYRSGVLKEETFFHSSDRFDRSLWDSEGRLVYEGVFLDFHHFQETTNQWPEGISNTRKGKWDGRQIRFE